MHRKFFLADSGNVLTLDKPCPLQDAQTTATIFGINGGPIMIGDDVDRMAPERLALLKKCLPPLPECATAIDLFDAPEPDYPRCFHLRVVAAWDQWDLAERGGERLGKGLRWSGAVEQAATGAAVTYER